MGIVYVDISCTVIQQVDADFNLTNVNHHDELTRLGLSCIPHRINELEHSLCTAQQNYLELRYSSTDIMLKQYNNSPTISRVKAYIS